jgi:hypothetical protein
VIVPAVLAPKTLNDPQADHPARLRWARPRPAG